MPGNDTAGEAARLLTLQLLARVRGGRHSHAEGVAAREDAGTGPMPMTWAILTPRGAA